jgi:hypothetical protein
MGLREIIKGNIKIVETKAKCNPLLPPLTLSRRTVTSLPMLPPPPPYSLPPLRYRHHYQHQYYATAAGPNDVGTSPLPLTSPPLLFTLAHRPTTTNTITAAAHHQSCHRQRCVSHLHQHAAPTSTHYHRPCHHRLSHQHCHRLQEHAAATTSLPTAD